MASVTNDIEARLQFHVAVPHGEEKLRELILYISQRCAGDSFFGATKLNKLLYYADFWAYAYHGRPITGVAYQRLPQGPAPQQLIPVRQEMIRNGDLELITVPFFKHHQKRTIALREPNVEHFETYELKMVDSLVAALHGASAEIVSEVSHGSAWEAFSNGELIPYQTAFIDDDELNDADKAWGWRVANELGINA